ncbi:helix-turn-helix domain-containing protein [bacterium]|nr:helix-turn-helix domain-containing protein [bacterium]
MTDQPLLQTPGEMLAGARKAQGDSLEVVAARTKIPPAMLAAIEADEYHKISGHLYVRSFLRTYAADIGLDPDRILDLYAKMSGERTPITGTTDNPVWEEEEVVVQKIGVPWKLLLGIAVVCILVGAGLFVMLDRGGDTPAEGEIPLTGEPGTEAGSGGIVDQAGALADSLEAAGSPPDSAAGATADLDEVETRVLPPPALPGTTHLDLLGTDSPNLVLRVLCPEKMEIEVRSDSDPGFTAAVWPREGDPPPLPAGDIRPGQVYGCREGFVVYWGAGDHFSLRLGRTRGVEVHLNGNPHRVEGLGIGQEILLDRHSTGG